MQQLFVIDVTRGYLPAALLTAAAYALNGEVLLVQGDLDHSAVEVAVDRFHPTAVLAMPECAPPKDLGHMGSNGLPVEVLPFERPELLAWLIDRVVESARGVVLFAAHSPSWAVKAAALATRLGYLAWPLEEAVGFAFAAPPGIPVLVLGEAPGAVADLLLGREFRHLPGDRAVAQYLREIKVPVEYLVLVNSADLMPPAYTGPGMATYWTQGLSLLAPMLASYRSALVIDARTPRADSKEIERSINQKVAETGLRPEHFAILASPGAIPFVSEPHGSVFGGEELTRELHLRLNQDLFFDCAEGRLFGLTAGKVSLQLLCTKNYADMGGDFHQNALLCSPPHEQSGIAVALQPMLTRAGLEITRLSGKESTPTQIARQLRSAGLAIYDGDGSADSLHTHEAPLYPECLPSRVAPGVVCASTCSTMYPGAVRYSADGGFSFEDEVTPYGEQMGPAFVDRGALAFVGGLNREDLPLARPTCAVFVQSLVLGGLSVGQAIREARNRAIAYLAVLSQSAPAAYDDCRAGAAKSLQGQILLGDPAFTPYTGTNGARLPVTERVGTDAVDVSLTVPVGEEVLTWDYENMGAYLHMQADLPFGRVPTALTLEAVDAVETAPGEWIPCGRWAFATEERTDGLRVHWLLPARGTNGVAPHAILLRSARFRLEHTDGVWTEGRLELAQGQSGRGAPGALEGTRGPLPDDLLLSFGWPATIAQTLSGPGGRWSCWLPTGADLSVRVSLPMPVYRFAQEGALSLRPDTVGPLRPGTGPISLNLKPAERGVLRGVVVDGFSGRPLGGARVWAWRGKQGERAPIIDGYLGEAKADTHGRFEFAAPTGSYLVCTAHRTDLRYFPGQGAATVYQDRASNVLVAMEPGAVITGRVECAGGNLPKRIWIDLTLHGDPAGKVVGGGYTRRDGQFEILAPTSRPFDVVIHPEGFGKCQSDGAGAGYHLEPGQQVECSFRLVAL